MACTFAIAGFGAYRYTQGQESGYKTVQQPIGPNGEPRDVIVANPPSDPGTPTTYGPFRLLPFGYQEKTPITRSPAPPERSLKGVDPTDTQLLRSAPFYVELDPSLVPRGFGYAPPYVSVLDQNGVRFISWSFRGTLAARLVIQRGYASFPIDIQIPAHDATYRIEQATLSGHPAIFHRDTSAPNAVYFVEQNVVTIVTGDVVFEDALKLAEAIAARSSLPPVSATPLQKP